MNTDNIEEYKALIKKLSDMRESDLMVLFLSFSDTSLNNIKYIIDNIYKIKGN